MMTKVSYATELCERCANMYGYKVRPGITKGICNNPNCKDRIYNVHAVCITRNSVPIKDMTS